MFAKPYFVEPSYFCVLRAISRVIARVVRFLLVVSVSQRDHLITD